MKKLFMLPVLFLFTTSAQADNVSVYDGHQKNTTPSQYEYDSAQPLPLPVYENEPHFSKLLQIIDDDQPVITIKARMTLIPPVHQNV